MTVAEVISAMIEYLDGNIHEIEHMLKVYGYAKTIGEMEKLPPESQRILEIAAAVHDIGIPPAMAKYGRDDGPYQEELGPDEARRLLEKLGCDEAAIERVCTLVGRHHTYTNVDGLDLRILLEADFLVNAAHKKLNRSAILAARENFFRTDTGRKLLDSVLLKA